MLDAIPELLSVMVLLAFVFAIFGILGLQVISPHLTLHYVATPIFGSLARAPIATAPHRPRLCGTVPGYSPPL